MFVSHSVPAVRDVCNKILWIDHGRQIAFSDDVELYCDAYEEFLYTKKLPKNEEDVHKLAVAYQERMKALREENQEKEVRKLETIIENGDKPSAVKTAIRILRKNHPEVLNEEIIAEEKLD